VLTGKLGAAPLRALVTVAIESVISALRFPPPANGAVVEIVLVVFTVALLRVSKASLTVAPVTPESLLISDAT
jgi:hypothetical protein